MLSPLTILCYRMWMRTFTIKKKSEFKIQFKETLQALSTALNVGYSVENAVRETRKEMSRVYREDSLIAEELSHMVHQLDMNIPLEKVLSDFATRTDDRDVKLFVAIFSMAKRSGGDMIAIIRNAIFHITERLDMVRESQTLIAAKKLEFQIMTAIPLGMVLYMKLCFAEMMGVLYGNLFGMIFMSGCMALYIGAYIAGQKMVEIEV